MYRKFWITNGKEETIYYTEPSSKIFLNNPAGLGINNALTTNTYINQLNVITNEQNFNQISGEILFYDNSIKDKYTLYNEYATFLTNKPLTLYYEIPTETPKVFSIDVDVLTLDKTEIKNDGLLRCNFTFQTLSRWKGESVEYSGTSNTYEIVNDGHIPVGFEITISGNMVSPYFTLSQNNDLYGEAKFDDVNEFNEVYVNSNDGKQRVVLKQDGSILPNSLSYQDLSVSNGSIYVTFIKLARGNSTLTIGCASGSVESVNIKFTPLYRSV